MSETDAALAPLLAALEADGYATMVEESPDVVVVTITAGPGACADCLSPRAVMEPVLTNALRSAGLGARLELVYPSEH